jgi:hypothetical protein
MRAVLNLLIAKYILRRGDICGFVILTTARNVLLTFE